MTRQARLGFNQVARSGQPKQEGGVEYRGATVTITTFEQQFTIRVAGVTHSNADGTSRQSLLAKSRPSEIVELRREPDNPHDRFAIAVLSSRSEALGYIPAGDRRLADHIDRGGQVRAEILKITGGPNWFQRLLGLRGRPYGCVLRITKGDFDWKAVTPWMDADREIDSLMKSARTLEKAEPERSRALYKEVIVKIMALDSNGPLARAWRTTRYPINRLSLLLDRQGKKAEALAEIARWRRYSDPVGVSDADRESVAKREACLARATAT